MATTQPTLSELAERYTRLFETAQDGILILDYPDGRIEDANPYICRLMEYGREELLGKHMWELGVFTDKDKALAAHQSILTTGYVRYDNLDLVTKSGARVPVELVGNSYPTSSRMVIQCNIREISVRKMAEVALAQEQAKLTQQIYNVVDSLSNVIEARDPYTAGHQARVTDLAVAIAHEMKLSPSMINCIRFCAQLHDIGKIAIPSEILTKPTTLNPMEIALLRSHVQIGHDILKPLTLPWPVASIVLQHHERLDGSGYPHGLKNGEICQEARIIAVADTLEALTTTRPYRPAIALEGALKEIEEGAGVLYDADVVSACLILFRTKMYQFPARDTPSLHRL